MKRKKRVIIGMSGGVDSSVAAALLKKRGYEVIGMTLQLLEKDKQEQSACCNLSSVNDAKRVAYQLKIPHYIIDIRQDFQEKVIQNFINQYHNGQTPNPCVECNRHIKFDHILKKASEIGFDLMATGHYCIRRKAPKKNIYHLYKGNDEKKDQSYFLYMLTQEQLKRTVFPLGGYTKPKIRELAKQLNLVNAQKKESQEICFVPKDYKKYVESHSDTSQLKGNIELEDGTVIGTHPGIHHYTIGQSKGLGLSHHERLFVLKIIGQDKTVVVGPKEKLFRYNFTILKPSWIGNAPNTNDIFDLKVRYQMTSIKAKIKSEGENQVQIESNHPISSISPGQSAVLYQNNRVVGGGIVSIDEVVTNTQV